MSVAFRCDVYTNEWGRLAFRHWPEPGGYLEQDPGILDALYHAMRAWIAFQYIPEQEARRAQQQPEIRHDTAYMAWVLDGYEDN